MRTRAALGFCLLASLAGCEKRDPLFCGMNPNDPRCNPNDAMLGGDAPAGFVTVGGNVTGLVGAGLVVQNNGADDKLIASNNAFRFATAIPMGTAYAVTIGTQPTNPSQTCTVTNGSGTADTDVTNIQIDCTTASYTVGGTVVGCGSGCANVLVLTDNGGDAKTITGNGPFQFATPVPSQSAYAVAVQGTTGSCNVSGGMGIVGNANITSVVVNCTPGTYTLSGTSPFGGVSGLNGMVTLHAAYATPSGQDTISVSTNSFAFPTALVNNQTYTVTVTGQPAYPPAAQTCGVTQGSGTIMGQNVSSVTVSCATNQYAVGGMVTGLNGGTVVLKNNGADATTITANGAFTFATPIYSGLTYAATVSSQPMGQLCTVTAGSGTVANGAVNTIVVSCGEPGIKCGTTYCNPASQQCCNPAGAAQCIGNTQACPSLALPCDDAADCGTGKRCCAMTHNGNGNVLSVACATSCAGTNPVQMCDPATTECAAGTSCSAWANLPGYDACQ